MNKQSIMILNHAITIASDDTNQYHQNNVNRLLGALIFL